MRLLRTYLFPLALAAATGCATLHGGPFALTYIDAGKQFVLGGGQPGAFSVDGRNVGPVAVAVQERRADGTLTERGTLAPGQTIHLDLTAGSAALWLNSSTRQATVNLLLNGQASGLGMRYEGLRQP